MKTSLIRKWGRAISIGICVGTLAGIVLHPTEAQKRAVIALIFLGLYVIYSVNKLWTEESK